MSGIVHNSAALGGEIVVNINGKDYLLSTPTVANMLAVEQHAREQVVDPIPALLPTLKQLPQAMALEIYKAERNYYLSQTDLGFEGSLIWACQKPSRLSFLVWLMLEDRYRGEV